MSFDNEHAELLGALRGETCDEASRGRMREKLAAAGVLSASAAAAGTAATAVAHAAPAKAGGVLKLLTAGKLLGGGALLAVGTVVVVSLATPPERPAARPAMHAAPSPAPVAPVVKAPVVEPPAEVEPAPPPRKHTRPSVRTRDTLAKESALLTGAARRLHAGDLEGALRMLDEHERSFPDGVLRTERELARQRVESERRAHEAP